MLRKREDPENLAFADVRADLDGEACVAFEAFLGRHSRKTSPRC